MEKNKRVDYLDVARGIAMFLIILGHTHTNYYVSRFCYLINLPLFIMISGYFFKKDESIKQIVKKSLKIIIPAFSILLITRIADIYILGKKYTIFKDILFAFSKNTLLEGVYGIGMIWFIPFLVTLKIMFCVLNKISRNNKIVLGILVFVFAVYGVFLAQNKLFLPWSFDLVLCSLFLFYIGYLLKEKEFLENNIDKKIVWIAITAIFWTIFLGIKIRYWNFELATRRMSLFGLVLSGLGCLMTIKFSYIIQKSCKRLSKWLGWIGRNSYLLFISHYLESRYIVPNYWITVSFWIAFPIKLLSTVIVTAFMYYLRSQIRVVRELLKDKKEGEKNEQVSE